jgi:hypothetical protein
MWKSSAEPNMGNRLKGKHKTKEKKIASRKQTTINPEH